jgi:hypothetical protein
VGPVHAGMPFAARWARLIEMPAMNKRRNPQDEHGRQAEDTDQVRPASRKFEGRRSANEVGDAAANRPKPGRAQKKRALKNRPG